MTPVDFDGHLASGTTHVARCWKLTREDGIVLGFTDHDCDLAFDGVTFHAGSGLSAGALSQSSGLAVDNAEAVGALRDAGLTEADIAAGRYDGARIEAWLVQWDEPENRVLQFRGSLGDVTRANGAFTAELRGLAEALNVPLGRVYQKNCCHVLGDMACRVDLDAAAYTAEVRVISVSDGRVFVVEGADGFARGWFERGVLSVIDGPAQGLRGTIKRDIPRDDAGRDVALWDRLRANVRPGDRVALSAGCDKRMETCRVKFSNTLNFGGFPDIPGDDWLVAHPTRVTLRGGGSRR